jgi:SPP1 family phage portal protein
MQTTEDIIKAIQSDDFAITSLMISSLIEDHMMGEGKHIEDLWKRYKLKDVPIMHHQVANYTKVNEKIPNDFFADIVDTKVGYMGNEVTTTVSREAYKLNDKLNEPEYMKDRLFLRDWQNRTYSEDKNSEQVRDCGATGRGYRLLYVPEGINEVKIMNLNPWEVIYVYDASLDEAVAAIRYWTMDKKVLGGKVTKAIYVEWYDKKYITYYVRDESQDFHIDLSKGVGGIQEHLFNGVPIIPFVNNGIKYAEPEKALSLIDAYDLILSATTSEIEQFRLAYMYVKGAGLEIDNSFVKGLEQTGLFPLDSDGEIGFINKQLAIEGVKVILDEIRKNIYQFSKSIDLSKDFGGDIRVIGWQVALLNMESSSIITERKFRMSLRKQYQLLTDYWREFQQVDIDPYAIDFTFTRNFPRDIQAEAETLNLLLTAVSKETAYSQMSFIDDPEAEIAKMEAEPSPFRDDPRDVNLRERETDGN